jgi:hypothetical protein
VLGSCSNGNCSSHGETTYVGAEVGAKLALGAAGMTAGAIKKDPWMALGLGLVGAFMGHVLIDQHLIPACPECGQAIQIIKEAI